MRAMAERPTKHAASVRARLLLKAERAFGAGAARVTGIKRAPATAARSAKPAPVAPQGAPVPPRPAPAPPQSPQSPRPMVMPTRASPAIPARPAASTELPLLSDAPFTSPVLAREEKIKALADLDANFVKGCTKCRLSTTRTNTVFGEGDPDAKIFFIGEGPGENEDLQGRPFVGRAGELLTKQIGAMGLAREQVFIANIVKCRPPGNRAPAADETAACTPYLERQIEIVRPKVIVTLGLPASKYILQSKESMSRLRGVWQAWRGIKVMPTFHPAYLLRSYTDANRRAVWDDLQKVMTEVGLKPPGKSAGR
jgi:DNA polymerase